MVGMFVERRREGREEVVRGEGNRKEVIYVCSICLYIHYISTRKYILFGNYISALVFVLEIVPLRRKWGGGGGIEYY